MVPLPNPLFGPGVVLVGPVVEVAVETPTRLSKEQKALLEQFRETETGEECPECRGFFERLKDAFGA